jgi:hypothetical protein
MAAPVLISSPDVSPTLSIATQAEKPPQDKSKDCHQGKRKPEKTRTFTASQLVTEDIQCSTGLVFQDIDEDGGLSKSNIEKFGDRPHVKRFLRKRRRTNVSDNGDDKDVLFKASMRIQEVFVNLGTHKSSVSAAAAVDLANVLCSEHDNTHNLQVLSHAEANLALRSADARKIPTSDNPSQFIPFNAERKKAFEYDIEKALSCIGGEDESLSLMICSIDKKTQKQAEISSKRNRSLPTRNKEERERKSPSSTVQNITSSEADFHGKHHVFEVDEEGVYSWTFENFDT